LYSVIIGFAKGLGGSETAYAHSEHVVYALLVLFLLILTGVIFRWYKNDDPPLAPKFKYLIMACAVLTIYAGASLNSYVWIPPPPPPPTCNGLYRFSDGVCFKNIDACYQPDFCLKLAGKSGICVNCSCVWTPEALVEFAARYGEMNPGDGVLNLQSLYDEIPFPDDDQKKKNLP